MHDQNKTTLLELKSSELDTIPAIGPDGEYFARSCNLLKNCFGKETYKVCNVSIPVVSHWIEIMKKSTSITQEEIRRVMLEASILLKEEKLIDHKISLITGTPINVIKECISMIMNSLIQSESIVNLSLPKACEINLVTTDNKKEYYGAKWCRKGDIFFVQAAGNSPGIHALWLEALSLGYKVIVRPSHKDPLTPYYLISALHKAGLPRDYLIMVPCNYDVVDYIINKIDYALIYGNQHIVEKFKNQQNILVQGPGRSKLIVTSDFDINKALELAYDGVLFHGGTACTSTSVIFFEGLIRNFSNKLKKMFDNIELYAPWDDLSKLPAFHQDDSELILKHFNNIVSPEKVVLQPRIICKNFEDKLTFITPGIIEVNSHHDNLISVEWPFSCVCIAPYNESILDYLANSLVVSIASNNLNILEKIINIPSISNVFQNKPTSWHNWKVPHDSFLSEFLMRTKGINYEIQ